MNDDILKKLDYLMEANKLEEADHDFTDAIMGKIYKPAFVGSKLPPLLNFKVLLTFSICAVLALTLKYLSDSAVKLSDYLPSYLPDLNFLLLNSKSVLYIIGGGFLIFIFYFMDKAMYMYMAGRKS